MPKITLNKNRDKTNVFLNSRWKHLQIENPIYIKPFTPMSELLTKLETALNTEYSLRQIVELKSFFQKFEKNEQNETLR